MLSLLKIYLFISVKKLKKAIDKVFKAVVI